MVKSANLYARIEPEIKEQVEKILSTLGIPASNVINMFYKQIILQRGFPFEVKIPDRTPTGISMLGTEELYAELEKGYADMKAGRTKDAKTVFELLPSKNAEKQLKRLEKQIVSLEEVPERLPRYRKEHGIVEDYVLLR